MPRNTERTTLAKPRLLGLVALLVLGPGCGGQAPTYSEVEGTVTLSKKPLAGVIVEFHPILAEGESYLPFSRGITDENGKYQLTCENKHTGAVLGNHHVVIRRPVPDQDRNAPPQPPPEPVIPPKFSVALMSPIEVEVTADQHIYDIDLDQYK